MSQPSGSDQTPSDRQFRYETDDGVLVTRGPRSPEQSNALRARLGGTATHDVRDDSDEVTAPLELVNPPAAVVARTPQGVGIGVLPHSMPIAVKGITQFSDDSYLGRMNQNVRRDSANVSGDRKPSRFREMVGYYLLGREDPKLAGRKTVPVEPLEGAHSMTGRPNLAEKQPSGTHERDGAPHGDLAAQEHETPATHLSGIARTQSHTGTAKSPEPLAEPAPSEQQAPVTAASQRANGDTNGQGPDNSHLGWIHSLYAERPSGDASDAANNNSTDAGMQGTSAAVDSAAPELPQTDNPGDANEPGKRVAKTEEIEEEEYTDLLSSHLQSFLLNDDLPPLNSSSDDVEAARLMVKSVNVDAPQKALTQAEKALIAFYSSAKVPTTKDGYPEFSSRVKNAIHTRLFTYLAAARKAEKKSRLKQY